MSVFPHKYVVNILFSLNKKICISIPLKIGKYILKSYFVVLTLKNDYDKYAFLKIRHIQKYIYAFQKYDWQEVKYVHICFKVHKNTTHQIYPGCKDTI